MRSQALARPQRPALFEPLEARLLLDGAPVGPVPAGPDAAPTLEAPPIVCGPPAAPPEPTSLTFNGRGIDLNHGQLGDQATAAADADGDGKLGLNDVKSGASAGAEVQFKSPHVVDMLGAAVPGQTEARWPDGEGDLRPDGDDDIVILRPEFNPYEQAGEDDPTPVFLTPENNPLTQVDGGDNDGIVFLVPEFNPYDTAGEDEEPIVFLRPEHNPLTQDGAAPQVKIMALRVGNPESAPADEPIGQADTAQPTFGPGHGGKGALGGLLG